MDTLSDLLSGLRFLLLTHDEGAGVRRLGLAAFHKFDTCRCQQPYRRDYGKVYIKLHHRFDTVQGCASVVNRTLTVVVALLCFVTTFGQVQLEARC